MFLLFVWVKPLLYWVFFFGFLAKFIGLSKKFPTQLLFYRSEEPHMVVLKAWRKWYKDEGFVRGLWLNCYNRQNAYIKYIKFMFIDKIKRNFT